MVARSLFFSWPLAALLGLAASAGAKPPDLPNDPRDQCETEEFERVGIDFAHLTPDGKPMCTGFQLPPMPERRYSNGNPLLRSALFGIHPALSLVSENVLHCDDDEPFPVLELLGELGAKESSQTPTPAPRDMSPQEFVEFVRGCQPASEPRPAVDQQVMLKVAVAEVDSSAARKMGLNFSSNPVSVPITLDNGHTGLCVEALRKVNLARSVGEPTLVTLHGQSASILMASEVPVPVKSGDKVQGIDFIPVSVQLNFTPYVTDKDHIRLQLNATVSKRQPSTSGTGLDTRNISTTVEMREGQTVALGGLSSVGDSELVLLVTPQLIQPIEPKVQATPTPPSVCPYLRARATAKPVCADENDLRGDVLANLEQLEMAEKAFRLAEFYRRTGHPGSAQFYYQIIHRECPGSRYDMLAKAKIEEMKRQTAGEAEECEEPETKPSSAEPPSEQQSRIVPKALEPARSGVKEEYSFLGHWPLCAEAEMKPARWRVRVHLSLTDFVLDVTP